MNKEIYGSVLGCSHNHSHLSLKVASLRILDSRQALHEARCCPCGRSLIRSGEQRNLFRCVLRECEELGVSSEYAREYRPGGGG